MAEPLTITEFRRDPDEALRRAKDSPVTITSRGQAVAQVVSLTAPRCVVRRGGEDLSGCLASFGRRGSPDAEEVRKAIARGFVEARLIAEPAATAPARSGDALKLAGSLAPGWKAGALKPGEKDEIVAEAILERCLARR